MSGGDGWSGAISGFALGAVGGAIGGYFKAKESGLNVWTGKELPPDLGKYPAGYINTTPPDLKGPANSSLEYTAPNGKPISTQFYNSNGEIKFQIDYKNHAPLYGRPHGHNFIKPTWQSGHSNHVPTMKIPINYFNLRQ